MAGLLGKRGKQPQEVPVTPDSPGDTTIGPGTTVHGGVTVEGTMRVEGLVEGEVTATVNVIVGKTGRITGDVRGQSVLVAGQVRGNIATANRLEILSTGKIWGDVTAPTLLIEEGALFSGRSLMHGQDEPDGQPTHAKDAYNREGARAGNGRGPDAARET
jgi:cytoskeletal protein CcmA (bactofilin family)